MSKNSQIILGLCGLALLFTAIGIRYANKGHCVRFKAGNFKKFSLYETDINC